MDFFSSQKIKGHDIARVKFVPSNDKICKLITKMTLYFFKNRINLPFSGFLLEGPPSTGKTEIARQVARVVDDIFLEADVYLDFVDSSRVAASKWGEAEYNLRQIFEEPENSTKKIILIDDMDCLLIKRGESIAKEWHYSINSILFHVLDELRPHNVIVIATTNRPDLIDDALRSRLYSIEVAKLGKDDLIFIANEIISQLGLKENERKRIIESVANEIKKSDTDSIRKVQQVVMREFIERRVDL